MLRAITIENFKAFGAPTRIELAPITLIFGENSAGKSSILHALNLLKQTYESRESGAALLPRAEDGIVDLGSFKEFIFDHDTSRTLRLGVEFSTKDGSRMSRRLAWGFSPSPPESFSLTLCFKKDPDTEEVMVSGIGLSSPEYGDVARFRTRPLTAAEQQNLQRYMWTSLRARSAQRRPNASAAQCEWISDADAMWLPFYMESLRRRKEIVAALDRYGRMMLENRRRLLRDTDDDAASNPRQWSRSIELSKAFYSRNFTLPEFKERMRRWALETSLAMDGFVPGGAGAVSRGELPEWEAVEYRTGSFRDAPLSVPDVARFAIIAGRYLEESLNNLFPMGPFRRPPQRWYIFTGTSPVNVGYKGDHLPDLMYRQSHRVDEANRWLRRLEVGYEIVVRAVGDRDSDLFEVRLLDKRRSEEVDVALSDVGFGISQILPFIVQSLATERQIISIEQPEVHIHPRLQADLGDLIGKSIDDPHGHQFLIETHSEHLVLRLQRLIREGALRPDQVSIIYVSRGSEGSRAQRLHLDQEGDFVDDWPGGFFPERLKELA